MPAWMPCLHSITAVRHSCSGVVALSGCPAVRHQQPHDALAVRQLQGSPSVVVGPGLGFRLGLRLLGVDSAARCWVM